MNRVSEDRAGWVLVVAALLLFCAPQVRAQSAAAKTYQMKCAACHAADGSSSEVGKKLGAHDFHSSQVQGESDDEINQIIAGEQRRTDRRFLFQFLRLLD